MHIRLQAIRCKPLIVLLLSLLYLGVIGAANRTTWAQESAAPEANKSAPHIAVLLPTESPAFARAADAVRRGVLEAYRVQPLTLAVVIYTTSDDAAQTLKRYQQALDAQAQLVIGPLTRSAVNALASSDAVAVPTLALNSPDSEVTRDNLYFFGLQIESDARLMAQLADDQGHHRALILTGKGPLTARLAQAFAHTWRAQGNSIAREVAIGNDPAEFAKLREQVNALNADMVFAALEAQPAKLARAYLGPSLPIYATSLVHTGNDPISRLDLAGIIFADMPWLVAPDDPAVMTYARPDLGELSFELQRFYALGIDAYRIARELLRHQPELSELDGVTGRITLERNHRVVRTPVAAQFVQGEVRALSDPSRPSAPAHEQ
ncbi:MAG TPA: penicillin-binding protein activator [Burkholderiales bacterium]|nr:penicillin-binding protein activator [Burkholderiales bacterium]